MRQVNLFHFTRSFLIGVALFFCASPLLSEDAHEPPCQNLQEDAEAMFLRRIVEFWESGQYSVAKEEIGKYLEEHPGTHLTNDLLVFLGDVYLKEGKFEEAIVTYKKIKDNSVKLSVYLNYLQCLLELKKYQNLISECSFYLHNYSSFLAETTQQVKVYLGYAYYESAMNAQGDAAQAFARMAKPYFEDLLKTNFCEESLQILTSLHQILQDYRSAGNLYLSLSEKYPERKEEFLFEAANCALEFDRDLALQTFSTICRTGKAKVHEAADQRMRLLYEMKKYSDLILLADALADLCSKENLPFFHFLLGSSYFELKDYKHAALEMKKYIDREEVKDEKMRDALALIMSAAHQMKDRELFEESFASFEKNFPKDEELPKALLAKALLNKKDSRPVEAEKDFSQLVPIFSTLEDSETFLYEYADLLLQMKEASKSKEYFSKLLQITKNEAQKREALRGLIHASVVVAFEEKDTEKAIALKKDLVVSLQTMLSEKEALSDQERDEYLYLLGQCQFECKEFASALEVLEPLTEKSKNCPHLAQVHLFLAQCADRINKDKKSYCRHVETALALKDPSLKESSLHLLLFNGYFELGQENQEMLSMAAEHLFLAQLDETIRIQEDNQLWLAQYYYQRSDRFMQISQWRAKEEEKLRMQEERRRAISLIEKNVTLPPKETITPQEEEALFKLANLFQWDQNREKSLELFTLLQDQYKKDPTTCWNRKEPALLSLSKSLREKGDQGKAMDLLDEVISLKRDPFAVMKASFEKCLLRISLLTEEEKSLSSPQVVSIIAELKQIKLQRKLAYEPLHFEAALALVELESSLEKEAPF